MKKATFVNNGKVIATSNGKMQFNTATIEFRNAMSFRHNAACVLAQAEREARDRISEIKNAVKVLESSKYFNSADVDALNAEIVGISDALKAMRAEYNDKAPATTDADHNLYLAYRAYITGNDDTINSYERAFMEWADYNGMKPTHDTFKFITKSIGAKAASATDIIKNGGTNFTKENVERTFLKLFYAEVLNICVKQNLVKPFAFTYKLPERKKNAKKVGA